MSAFSAEKHTDTHIKMDDLKKEKSKEYRAFVAGMFSGVGKLTVGHPFDTIKVRMQTSTSAQFSGPLKCFLETVRKEGARGLYKGATPPLIGWIFMDAVMLGSLDFYRKVLHKNIFTPDLFAATPSAWAKRNNLSPDDIRNLPSFAHGIAGIMAGITVSFVAAPFEHIKARLQIQYSAKKSDRLYAGPVDALRRIYKFHGIPGVYHGLSATLLFRSFFFFWWSTYDIITKELKERTNLGDRMVNFCAGGIGAQAFWLTSYPSDVVKQRIMTDPLGGGLNDGKRMFPTWKSAAQMIYRENGVRGFWRGFLPCFLRSFPANAVALVAYEEAMRRLP